MGADPLLPTPLFATGVFLLGLLIGSFLNVVVYRLPARIKHDWRCQCRDILEIDTPDTAPVPPGIVRPRSRCRACGHAITPLENIPVISYLWLRGKCSACGARISARYPLVELLTAVLFAGVAVHFGPTPQALAGLVLTAFLIVLAAIDLDHQLLPDSLTIPLLWIGLLLSCYGIFTTPVSAILGAVIGYGVLWLIFHGFRLLTGKEGMGYGDFKLMAALGAWLGWALLPLIVLISSLVGAVLGILLIWLKKHESEQPIPFGPFIAVAGWVCLIWGHDVISAYLSFSGLR